jgi:putative ABC transport system permease protein
MKTKHIIATALDGLTTHKSRSALTTLGIIIGVAAIIVVMALGNGAQALILGTIESLGAETAVVQPGSPGSDFGDSLLVKNLTQRDFDAITRPGNVPNLTLAMPQVFIPGKVAFEDNSYSAQMTGGTAEYYVKTFNIYPERGTVFTDSDVRNAARVAIIGQRVEDKLFGVGGNAVGEMITVGGKKVRVIGVFPQKGSLGFFNVDEVVLVPYTTAQTYITGTNHFNQILIKADSPDNVDKLVFDVGATLRDTHKIDPGMEDDFSIQTQKGLVEQVSTIVTILTAFLAAVVSISLVVGGVGIMNIMLVSVTERTKEIGLRKALGATQRDIRRQFLFEAVMLTGFGGIVGVIIGTLIAFLASIVLSNTVAEGWKFVFPLSAAILGVGVSAGVGLVFGIYPATQAAKKSPIEALRYE